MDNHGHTTKVHHRDVKKIPMTEKVCQLYEEEQIGKVREGRKAVPSNKMPELGWDIAETQLHKEGEQAEYQESTQRNSQQTPHPVQAIIAIAIIITKIMEHIRTYIQEIRAVARKTTQALKFVTTKTNHSKLMQNIKESYRTAMLAVTIATRTTNHTSCISEQKTIGINKILQAHKNLVTNMMDHTSRIHPGSRAIVTTIKTSCRPVSNVLHKDRTKHRNT